MALTGRRLRELRGEELRQVSLDRVSHGPAFSGSMTRIRSHAHWGLLLAWVVFLPVAYALEPAAATAGPEPLWAAVLGFAMTLTLAVTGAGLVRRHRIGLIASAAAAALFLVGSVMCPVSAHHVGVGAWWFAQMAGFLALGAVSLVGLRSFRAQP
jgi:hypothetical protein